MAKQISHVHKYKRVKWGKKGTEVWRCMLVGCPHYCHPEMVRNRKSLCWECGRVFGITMDKMRRVKPKCDDCQHRRDPIMTQLDDLIGGL